MAGNQPAHNYNAQQRWNQISAHLATVLYDQQLAKFPFLNQANRASMAQYANSAHQLKPQPPVQKPPVSVHHRMTTDDLSGQSQGQYWHSPVDQDRQSGQFHQ